MQIEFYSPTPEQAITPVSWNYEEVKTWLVQSLGRYRGIVYTPEMITDAKKDRAALNKLASAIDEARKAKKAQYLKPYEEFEGQAKELTKLIKDSAAEIDAQVKAFEEEKKQKKMDEIISMYALMIGNLLELVPYEKLHDPKWLNASVNMKTVEKELGEKIISISEGFEIIARLNLDEVILAQARSAYMRNFNIGEALEAADRAKAQRESLERYEKTLETPLREPQRAATADEVCREGKYTPEEESLVTVDFRVTTTREQLNKLKAFLNENGIKYGKVQ